MRKIKKKIFNIYFKNCVWYNQTDDRGDKRMNQILMTEQPHNNKRVKQKKEKRPRAQGDGEIAIESVVRFFAVVIISFGVCLSGSGGYALYQDVEQKASASEPLVQVERVGNSIKLTITNDIGIKSVRYWWNDSPETVVEGKNKTKVETTVNIVSGTGSSNKLTIAVVDTKNNTKSFVKNYIQEESDTTEPTIEITNEDPDIKITVTDDTALDYIVYKYGDGQEVKVYATEDSPDKIETRITDVKAEETLLSIEAVDKAQNIATKDQKVRGVSESTKPKIEVTVDPSDYSYLIIRASDDYGLRMVVFYINDQEYKTDPNVSLNSKNFEYRIQVNHGETTVKVNAYNLSEQVSQYEGKYNY